jgi:hypothetical protein
MTDENEFEGLSQGQIEAIKEIQMVSNAMNGCDATIHLDEMYDGVLFKCNKPDMHDGKHEFSGVFNGLEWFVISWD